MWHFRKINERDVPQIKAYKEAMLASNSSMDGCNGLSYFPASLAFVEKCKMDEEGKNLPKYLVPSSQFVCVNDKQQILGMCNIRHYLNDSLLNIGGHVGYSVHPDYRNQGIATFMLKEALKICLSMNISDVLLTCHKENKASRRVILKCHGIYENTYHIDNKSIERYWIRQ